MFRRLSGQVIWALLEENDASQDECGLFMDTFYTRFQAMVRVLARTKSHPSGYIRITADKAHDGLATATEACQGCVGCSSLVGTIYPASMPRLIEHLPPYSLGCSLGLEFLKALHELSGPEASNNPETANKPEASNNPDVTRQPEASNNPALVVQETLPQVSYQLCCPRRPLSRIILAMREGEPLF